MDAPMALILLTVVIDLIGFGIVLPILPLWAHHFGANATEIGILSATYALMQVIFAPLWGRLSDRIGRRPVILVTLLGSCVSAFMIGIAHTLLLLFIARIINGVSGASYATAQAYVADITTEESRARGMGLIGAAFGIGFIIGPAIGALLSLISDAAPFFFASGLAAVNLVLAWRLLPESLRPGSPTAPMGRWEMMRHALTSRRLAPLVWLSFIATFAFVGMEATFALLGSYRFGYGEAPMGMLFAFVGVAAAVGQGVLVGRAVARYGETQVMLWGLVGTAVGLALLAVGLQHRGRAARARDPRGVLGAGVRDHQRADLACRAGRHAGRGTRRRRLGERHGAGRGTGRRRGAVSVHQPVSAAGVRGRAGRRLRGGGDAQHPASRCGVGTPRCVRE